MTFKKDNLNLTQFSRIEQSLVGNHGGKSKQIRFDGKVEGSQPNFVNICNESFWN